MPILRTIRGLSDQPCGGSPLGRRRPTASTQLTLLFVTYLVLLTLTVLCKLQVHVLAR